MFSRKKGLIFVKNIFLFLCGLCLIPVFFAFLEEYEALVLGVDTDSVTVSVVVTDSISLTSPSDISLSPEIVQSGSATGNVVWTVETNNENGWKLELNASTSPALSLSGDSFADYTEAVAGAPETWSVNSNASEFGFSAGGSYSESKYSSGTLFEGFAGENKVLVAQDSGITPGGGADTTINFKAEVGVDKNQSSGTYEAVITATATTL